MLRWTLLAYCVFAAMGLNININPKIKRMDVRQLLQKPDFIPKINSNHDSPLVSTREAIRQL